VVIEAVQWLLYQPEPSPTWYMDALAIGTIEVKTPYLEVRTLEGVMTANPGDWIICGVVGEIYPVKPSIFEATYEVAV